MSEAKAYRKMVVVDVYTESKKDGTTVEGRLLGLINDKEFNAIVSSKELQKKVLTKETIPLTSITENYQNLEDYRMVIAIKERDGTQFHPARLFISDKLGVVSFVQPEGNCGFTDRSRAYIMIEEKEVKNAEAS